jgi:DNA-binding CsgD family transcriptional regulator
VATTRDRSKEHEHSSRRRDAENCPALAGNAIQRAQYADSDAADFAMLVRDEPAPVVWGRVARWLEENPERLMATFVHLAAMVDVDERIAPWTRSIGGTAALHPDFREKPKPVRRSGGPPSKFREGVHDLLMTTVLSDIQIAERVGCSRKTVATYRGELGIHRTYGPSTQATDAKVAELGARGLSVNEIAAKTGMARSTVKIARRRIRAEQDTSAA